MPTIFDTRMAVAWDTGYDIRYGVITYCEDDQIQVVPVDKLQAGMHCFDEGINYDTDRDRVRLDSCPPPFTLMCIGSDTGKCFALAAQYEFMSFGKDEFERLHVLDEGEKISEKDFDTIFNHPWPEQPQKEFTPSHREPVANPVPDNRRYRQAMTAFSSLMSSIAEPEDEDESEKDQEPEFY